MHANVKCNRRKGIIHKKLFKTLHSPTSSYLIIVSTYLLLPLVCPRVLQGDFGCTLMYALVKGKSVSLDRNFKDSNTQRKCGIR